MKPINFAFTIAQLACVLWWLSLIIFMVAGWVDPPDECECGASDPNSVQAVFAMPLCYLAMGFALLGILTKSPINVRME